MKFFATLGLILCAWSLNINALHAQASSCTYTLEMFDSFGDGWNGATLIVNLGGQNTVYTVNPTDNGGFSRTVNLIVNNGQTLTLTFTPGVFDDEITYALRDSDGNILFSDGPDPEIGAVFTTTVVCPVCPALSPTGVAALDVRAFTARIGWVPTDPQGIYLIEYGPVGFTLGAGITVTATGNNRNLTGLQQNTSYHYYMRVVCASGDTSNVVGPFSFKTLFARDVGVTALITPQTACSLGPAEQIRVRIRNFGGNPQSLIPIRFSVNGQLAPVNIPVDGFYTGVLGKDSSDVFLYDLRWDFSEPGEYTLRIWTDLQGDSLRTNDTLTVVLISIPLINQYPYLENFETWGGGWRVAENSVNSSWQYGRPNSPQLNAAASGQNAWVTNLTGPYNNSELSYLVSPCLDFSSLTADPRLSFSLWFESESCCDEGWVERSIDGGQTWTKVGTAGTGLNWYNNATEQWWNGTGGFTGWVTALNTLTGTAGQSDVRIRFVFSSDGSVTNKGMAIDNVFIASPAAVDMFAINATYTAAVACGTETGTVRINLLNLGTQAQTGFNVAYSVNGGAPVVENVGALSIQPNQQGAYTFNTPIEFTQNGTYNIRVWSNLNGDLVPLNDTTQISVSVDLIPIVSGIPYLADFETGPSGWKVAPESVNPSWQFGVPAGTQLNAAASGQNAWVTNLTGNYNNNENSYLLSPCFDFSSLTQDPRLSFSLWFDSENCCDEGWVERSIDGGQTWVKVGSAGTGLNWYNNAAMQWWNGTGGFTGWVTAFNTLTGTAGQANVRLRFVFSSDGSVVREGMGIDNVRIFLPAPNDLAGTSAAYTPTQGCGSETGSLLITLANYGSQPQTGFNVGYSINGAAPVVENVGSLTIQPNQQVNYTFTTPLVFTQSGTYNIAVWSQLNNDQERSNDTSFISVNVQISPTISTFPYNDDFESGPGGWRIGQGSVNASWQFGTPAAPQLNAAASGLNAWVTNLTGNYNNSETSYLVSPCMDFSSLSVDPRFSFSLWFDSENNFDRGWVERSIDGGQNWTKVGTAGTGQNWYNDATNQRWTGTGGFTGWVTAFNTLTGTAGQANVRIRFVFTSDGSVTREGMGVDNVSISIPVANDLLTASASNTTSQPCGHPFDQIRINLVNLGTVPRTGFNVAYSINGGAPVVENVGGLTIQPGLAANFTFTTTFNSSLPGQYIIRVWTEAAGEQITSNDTTTFVFRSALPTPYSENFEGGVVPPGWTVDPDVVVTNTHGNTSFVITDNLWSGDNVFNAMTPPIGPIAPNDTLSFDYRVVNFSGVNVPTTLTPNDNIRVQVSTDCGSTFTTLLTINGTNHTPSATMTTRRIPLDAYSGQSIRIRFNATWGAGDYWIDIDNINISSMPTAATELLDRLSRVTLAPNPTSGYASLNIEFTEPVDAHILVMDATGRQLMLLREQKVLSAVYPVDLSNHPAGIYFVRIMVDNQVKTLKLVRAR